MAITLPRTKAKATRVSPSIMIIYGTPKVGKTKSISELDDCLIIDLEKGTERYDAMAVKAGSYAEMNEVIVALHTESKANGNKPVYKFLALDTLDELEEYAIHKAAEFYKETPMGKTWYAKNYKSPGVLTSDGERINMLPNGAGYGYIREAMKWYVEVLSRFCQYLILVAHIKDKKLPSMDGISEVIVKDISLTGKLGSILAANSDAIGYMYRSSKQELMISFKTNESAVMGSRCPHLAGQQFEFDWNRIYID
jgi:Cdc6-like AAA superfamily ATPase